MGQTARRPRIGISGAAGTGKSTLARALAAHLDLPYLEEGMRRRLEAGLDLHQISHEQHRALTGELLAEMRAAADLAVSEHGGFVCDRSPLDMAAFWIYYRFAFDLAATERFMTAARAALAAFDLIVLLPRTAIALEDDGVRSANPWIQLHFDAVLEAMTDTLLTRTDRAARVVRLPGTCTDLDARVDWVCDATRGERPPGVDQPSR